MDGKSKKQLERQEKFLESLYSRLEISMKIEIKTDFVYPETTEIQKLIHKTLVKIEELENDDKNHIGKKEEVIKW